MIVHAAAVGKNYSFDHFFDKLAKIEDKDFNDSMAVFITDFVEPVDILLEIDERWSRKTASKTR